MKKTGYFWGLFFAVCLLLTGCGKKEKNENDYTVYYINPSGMWLVENQYSPSAQTFDELMKELQKQMEHAPSNCKSALSGKVKIKGYERGIDALRIDFSKEYYGLGNTEEVLLRAATVKTFCQIPGVAKVMITVEGEQLKDEEGQPVPAMDADSFIDTKEGGINSYLYAKLSLFFPDSSGKKLAKEQRSLHYSSNMVLERVIIEQLIAGPKSANLRPVFTGAVKIQNLYIKNGVCTISFDKEVNKTPPEGTVSPEIAIEAIVNSICETCDEIQEVRFEIEGDNTVKFRDVVRLDQGFTAAGQESETEQTEKNTDEEADKKAENKADNKTDNKAENEAQTEPETKTAEVKMGKSGIGVDPSLTAKEKPETNADDESEKSTEADAKSDSDSNSDSNSDVSPSSDSNSNETADPGNTEE